MNCKSGTKAQDSDYRLQPGGGYCFHGWSGKPQGPKHHIPSPPEGKDEFSEWKDWMKDYLKEKNEEEKCSVVPQVLPKSQDVAWNTHVQQAREVQRQRANDLANAIVSSKQAKTAKMFQQRFERSEKFALVSEPGDKRPNLPFLIETKAFAEEDMTTLNVTHEHESAEEVEKEKSTKTKEESVENVSDDVADGVLPLHPPLPDHVSFLNIHPSNDALLVSPQPWKLKTDPLPPKPPVKNFNRSPKGFVGSYVTSYY
ncbi:uncharacterized protein LOC120346625 [Styela clava]